MNEIVDFCDKCGKAIPTGKPYISLSRSIEQIEIDPFINEYEVTVIHSDLLIALCPTCGQKFNQESLLKIIELLPGKGKEMRN